MNVPVHVLSAQLLLAQPAPPAATPPSPCVPAGMTRADLLRLRQSKFEVSSAHDRNRLAAQLLSCLDDPDPAIRDGVVFEGLSTCRGLLDAAFWEAWFSRVANPAPLRDWGAAFLSMEGLAKRHNTLAFLQALSFAGREDNDETGKAIAALADRMLTQIMGG